MSQNMNTEISKEMEDYIRSLLTYDKNIEKKEIICNVLKQKREWINADKERPPEGTRVVLHLMHTSEIDAEDPNKIYPKEDCQIGLYTPGIGWSISPPHPKYDYSRLSTHGKLHEGVVVTYWAIPIQAGDINELNGWDTRFDSHGTYKYLKLMIDPEHEESFYRALLWAANFMARSAGPDFYQKDSELRQMYERICDLQWAIDQTQYQKSNIVLRDTKTGEEWSYPECLFDGTYQTLYEERGESETLQVITKVPKEG